MSLKSREAILSVLAKHYESQITIVENLTDLDNLAKRQPDLVFLGMEFIPENPLPLSDNKTWISQFLDSHNITYTGSGQVAHELSRSKPLAKQAVLKAGLKTSPFCVAYQNVIAADEIKHLEYPLFVKPTSSGGGEGIDSDSVVHNLNQLNSKIKSIRHNQKSDSLIEDYLPGREFSVAILKDEFTNEHIAMPLELIAPPDKHGDRLLSATVKSADSEQFIEVLDDKIRSNITALALNSFHALGARDYGRIDIRLDNFGRPQFLEANLIPSLIEGYGNFPKACALYLGMDYETMLLTIVRLGFNRANVANNEVLNTEPLLSQTFSQRNL